MTERAASEAESKKLRLIARRTWRYFETFVTSSDNMLPPDNFQEDPSPLLARRTSPTNLGLYLLSSASAHDFGWKHIAWLLPWFGGLWLLSWLGGIGGGLGIMHFGWDILIVSVWSVIVYGLALRGALARDETAGMMARMEQTS